jgi:surface antigen
MRIHPFSATHSPPLARRHPKHGFKFIPIALLICASIIVLQVRAHAQEEKGQPFLNLVDSRASRNYKVAGPYSPSEGLVAFQNDVATSADPGWGLTYHNPNISDSGECVWFCRAVREDALPSTSPDSWARSMWNNAVAGGWHRGSDPKVGAVACFDAAGYPPYGHVAIVSNVNADGSIEVWESNVYTYHQVDKRHIDNFNGLQGYLYAADSDNPPHPTGTAQPTTIGITAPTNGATVPAPVTLTWTSGSGNTAFKVWRDGVKLTATPITAKTYTDTTVGAGAHSYVVWGNNGTADTKSATVAVTVIVPDTTVGITAPTNGATVPAPVTLTWTSGSGNTAFKVWRDGVKLTATPITAKTYTDSTVGAGAHSYVVWGNNGTADTKSATVAVTVIVPDTTVGITAPTNGATVAAPVTLTWTSGSGNTAFKVWRDGVKLTATPITAKTYTDTTVSTGAHSYVVWGNNGTTDTESDTVAVTVLPPPPTTYTATVSAAANGTVAPNGASTVNPGDYLSLTATPNPRYTVDTWEVDGEVVQTGYSTYGLGNVQANHTVTVTFKGPYAYGDLDCNGTVDEVDADLVLQYLDRDLGGLDAVIEDLATKQGLHNPPDVSTALWILQHISRSGGGAMPPTPAPVQTGTQSGRSAK